MAGSHAPVSTGRRAGGLAVTGALLLLLTGCPGSSDGGEPGPTPDPPASFAIFHQYVQPADTGSGIDRAGLAQRHYVALPQKATHRKPLLVVFLGGSLSNPAAYTDISNEAAALGHGVIDLRYPDQHVVGTVCAGDDECFTQYRGETLFGAGTRYAPGAPVYGSPEIEVDTANSIVNRLVSLLAYLSTVKTDWDPDPGYWRQFLVRDANSPYVVSYGNVYPDWSRIILAGHSQGGANAAFLALHLPSANKLHRVVMFSSPDDHVGDAAASWIAETSSTPLDRFWGLRNANEGVFGSFVSTNWGKLGGIGVGGDGARGEVKVGDGSGDPKGSHRIVITQPDYGSALKNHNSTAVNGAHNKAVRKIWAYLISGNGAD